MKYLWTEDIGAGLHFWKLVNQLFFDDEFVVESKKGNQGWQQLRIIELIYHRLMMRRHCST